MSDVQTSARPPSTREINSARNNVSSTQDSSSSDYLNCYRTCHMSTASSVRHTFRHSGSSSGWGSTAAPVAEAPSAAAAVPPLLPAAPNPRVDAAAAIEAHNDLHMSTVDFPVCLPVHIPKTEGAAEMFPTLCFSDLDEHTTGPRMRPRRAQNATSKRLEPARPGRADVRAAQQRVLTPPAPRHTFVRSLQTTGPAAAARPRQRSLPQSRQGRWDLAADGTTDPGLMPATRAGSTPAKLTMLRVAEGVYAGPWAHRRAAAAGRGRIGSASRGRLREVQRCERQVWVPGGSTSRRPRTAAEGGVGMHSRPISVNSSAITKGTAKQVRIPWQCMLGKESEHERSFTAIQALH